MKDMDGHVRILIADNDSLYLDKLCRRFMENTTWTVLPAGNASHALEIIRLAVGDVDIALIDTVMPQGDGAEIMQRDDEYHGIEAAKIIGREFPDIRVFGMSVDVSEDGELFWNTRADGFFEKREFKAQGFKQALNKLNSALRNDELRGFRNNFDWNLKPVDRTPFAQPGNPKKPAQRPRVNTRMLEMLMKNPEAEGWSTQQWANYLGCAKSTVCGTAVWKKRLSPQHKVASADKAVSRRHNGRSVRD